MKDSQVKESKEAESGINGESLLLLSPNIGQPSFLSLGLKPQEKTFKTCLLFISDHVDPKTVENTLRNEIKLIPIIEYKWKLRTTLEKKQKEMELIQKNSELELKQEEKRKRGFFYKLKKKFSKRKVGKLTLDNIKDEINIIKMDLEGLKRSTDDRLRRIKPRAYRGDAITPIIMNVSSTNIVPVHNLQYLKESCNPQGHLLRFNVFDDFNNFFKVFIEFKLTEEVLEFLETFDFIMFDIEHEKGLLEKRINYHSIVISKKDWNNFSFIHATDLHLAERNDRIFGIIKNWMKKSFIKGLDKTVKGIKDRFKSFLKLDSQPKNRESRKPLRRRLINPNNQFRKFIKIINKKVLQNELDFIVLTGDIIDFAILSKFKLYKEPKEIRRFFDFKYENTNWQVFKNILLNIQSEADDLKGVLKGEEILCPIFTVLGNHDYRPYHYDLTWAKMYTKIGLNASEAVALNELFSATYITAITKSPLALKGYWSEINISSDFHLKLGKNLLIFLNSGSDSFKNFRDLVTGHPSLTGLSFKQMKFLENLINHKYQEGDNIFLFLHGPPINTGTKRSIFKRFEKSLGKKIKTRIEEYKESLNQKKGSNNLKARIDGKFNVKFGTVSSNWEKLIKFCKDFTVLTLAGHTHSLKEYKLKDPEIKTRVYKAPPFSLKKLENPAAIFYDLYSELYSNAEDIEKNAPFIVQTPALGLGGKAHLAGAYREIKVQDGKLISFRVHFIEK